MENKSWETHYKRDRSSLSYPDENLVRLISKYIHDKDIEELSALDLGCGSGRHIKLMDDLGFKNIHGSDYSIEGLRRSTRFSKINLVNCSNINMPYSSESFNLVAAWGSLHYSQKDETEKMISELHRILKTDGIFFGTLRSTGDSYIKRGKHLGNNTWATDLNDLTGSIVSFFEEDEILNLFNKFRNIKLGLMERTIMGNLDKKISHWIISAEK